MGGETLRKGGGVCLYRIGFSVYVCGLVFRGGGQTALYCIGHRTQDAYKRDRGWQARSRTHTVRHTKHVRLV